MARLVVCPAVCSVCFRHFYAWLWRTPRLRTSLLARAPPWLLPQLRGSPRCPVLPYVLGAGKTFVPPAPLGSRQLPTLPSRSQLSTISVWRLNFCVRYGYRWFPPAIVTGNFLAPAPSKLHRSELTSKLHTLEALFRSSQRFHSPLPRFLSLPDQALDRLVSPSSTRYRASTGDLSTSSSLRGLTCFKQWQSSSSGGLHA